MTKRVSRQVAVPVRFLLSGIVNTGITYAMFVLLARIMNPSFAYTAAFATGVALSYILNAVYVFESRVALRSLVRFPAVYGLQYLYGLAALNVLTSVFSVPQHYAMLLVICTSVPLNFVVM